MIAVIRTQVVLVSAAMTVAAQLSAGHCNEGAVGPVDDLEVSNDKRAIDRDGTEASQTVL